MDWTRETELAAEPFVTTVWLFGARWLIYCMLWVPITNPGLFVPFYAELLAKPLFLEAFYLENLSIFLSIASMLK